MASSMDISGVMVDKEVLKNLPNMPGFALPEWKERNHKCQTWGIVNGQRIEHKEGLSHDKPKFVQAVRPQDNWRTGSMPDSTTRAVFKQGYTQSEYQNVPAWDALDRHVLRFYGYFKEAVVETNLENYRVRKVVIMYFLEDDTVQVTEPKQDNSGIPQGQLIKRHAFPGPDGGYLKPQDLSIGSDLKIYGKTIRITDCDPFTREYYSHLGIEQDLAHNDEIDPFLSTRQNLQHKVAKPPRTYEKVYREVMLGGGHINADMQQFLEKDRQVLRFFAVLDDLTTPQFERRPFIILFFLADDSLEIRELYPLNCGRDNFPIFYKRGKMPRGDVEVHGPQSQPRRKEDFVHGHEFYVGQQSTLSGNTYFIYDADDFTRQYFAEELGIKLEPKCDVQLPERAVPRAPTPPYNGYGSWDDSMSSVIHLIPKQPKKDTIKLFENEGKVLRFTAKFVDPKPEDANRLFVFNYMLADDTISVHEPPQRNLGIVTGRFLEKGIHMNMITGELFKPDDLLPGNKVKVFNHHFEMLDCDSYTNKYLNDPEALHRHYDLTTVVEKCREAMRQQFPLVRDVFRRFDTNHDGVLNQPEFKQMLEKFGFHLSNIEVNKVMKYFDSRKDGQVSYNEFCDAILEEDYTTEMLKVKPRIDEDHDLNYQAKADNKTLDREETSKTRKAVRELQDITYSRMAIVPRLYKEFQRMTHNRKISARQIVEALRSCGQTYKVEDLKRVILFLDPTDDCDALDYDKFFKALKASFHDMHASR